MSEACGCDDGTGFVAGFKKNKKETIEKLKSLENQIEAERANSMGGLYKGPYNIGMPYGVGEVVVKNGVMYSSSTENNTTVPPSSTWLAVLQSDYGYYEGE